MLNTWISILMFMISLMSFSFAHKLSTINKIFYLLPRSIMENALRLDESENIPYFEKHYLEVEVKKYFTTNLKPLLTTYELNFCYFFQNENDDGFLMYEDGVNISFRAKLIFDYKYTNSLTFTIKQHEQGN
ncbi:MAG: hypothetical protein GX132_00465 [Erysipelotrichia bacterium]|jgi:hypothetical protein|nr:hypothetical protein [Erysipelotrichia bacterium]